MDKLSWEAVEYVHTEKGSDWYWIVGIVTLSIAVIAVILNNVIFAILIIISAFTLSLFASRKPDRVPVTLDRLGVTFGKTRYPYSNLDAFWVETRDAFPRVLFKSKKVLMPYVVIHIHEEDADEIRHFLTPHLVEEEHSEPLFEKILIYLGF